MPSKTNVDKVLNSMKNPENVLFHLSSFFRLQSVISQHWFKKWLSTNLVPGHFVTNDDKHLCCLEATVD